MKNKIFHTICKLFNNYIDWKRNSGIIFLFKGFVIFSECMLFVYLYLQTRNNDSTYSILSLIFRADVSIFNHIFEYFQA